MLGQIGHGNKLGTDTNWSWGQVGLGDKLDRDKLGLGTNWVWGQIGRGQIGHGDQLGVDANWHGCQLGVDASFLDANWA